MTNALLNSLAETFDNVWLKTDMVPEALHAWQEELKAVLQTIEADSEEMEALKVLMKQWQHTMEMNKGLLEAHQAKLMKELATGEESYIQQKHAKKFKLQ